MRIFKWLVPLSILLAAFGLDRLEMTLQQQPTWMDTPQLHAWFVGAIRLAFALVVGLGLFDLFRAQPNPRWKSWVWAVLGLVSVLACTPQAAALKSMLDIPVVLPTTNRMFFLAGAFLLAGGMISLLRPSGKAA